MQILTVEPTRRREGKNDASREKEKTPTGNEVTSPASEQALELLSSGLAGPEVLRPAQGPDEPFPSPGQMETAKDLTSPSNSTQFTNELGHSYISSPELIVDELTALRSLSQSYPDMTPPLLDSSVFSDLDNPADDVFLPGSAYEALHTALRNRQLWTARPDTPSGAASPTGLDYPAPDHRASERARPGRFELSPDRENILWQNYLNEICLWVCSFVEGHEDVLTRPAGYVRQPPPLRVDVPPDG